VLSVEFYETKLNMDLPEFLDTLSIMAAEIAAETGVDIGTIMAILQNMMAELERDFDLEVSN
jgi:hypothetical protein